MQHLISTFLIKNKNCPLPGIGTLQVTATNAQPDFLNNVINAPVQSINFSANETPSSDLEKYISIKTKSSVEDAKNKLQQFCSDLKLKINATKSAPVGVLGNFIVDANKNIVFNATTFPAAFLQAVQAQRVIHPNEEHQIIVGDKETTNTAMTEYFNDAAPQKSKWWIWAIVLGVIALATIFIYLFNNNFSLQIGNATPV